MKNKNKKIKYYNPNKVVKNSRKGVNLGGKQNFTIKNVRLAMCECNFIFYRLNNNIY